LKMITRHLPQQEEAQSQRGSAQTVQVQCPLWDLWLATGVGVCPQPFALMLFSCAGVVQLCWLPSQACSDCSSCMSSAVPTVCLYTFGSQATALCKLSVSVFESLPLCVCYCYSTVPMQQCYRQATVSCSLPDSL